MHWSAHVEGTGAGTDVVQVRDASGRALSRGEVIALLRDQPAFRAFFASTLASSRFAAFCWETPPITKASAHAPYEHAIVESRALARARADSSDFEERFEERADDDVLVFPNLGRDAILVVPAPRADVRCYGHLAAFVRGAPAAQVDALFAKLARAIESRLGDAPLWVSTAGLGVSWLHVRLDSRPKYYRHDAYRRAP